MRCKSCNKIYDKFDWVLNTETQEHDDLCYKCRSYAGIALMELEEMDSERQDTSPTDT
jgi:hypothetical protein